MHYRRNGLRPGMLVGTLLVILGAVFLLDNFDVINSRNVLRYWPLSLILLGGWTLFTAQFSAGRIWGGIVCSAGGILLAREMGYLDIGMRDLWPLILIAIGLGFLLQRGGRTDAKATSADVLNELAIFGGGQRRVKSQDFQGGELFAMFGGIDLDLTGAEMAGDTAIIQASAIFGGIEMRVPVEWDVVLQGSGIFGGYDEKTVHRNPDDPHPSKRLVVKGLAVFGGVEVKN